MPTSDHAKCSVNISKALKYPISPIPLFLAHGDGQIRKTDKSKLLRTALPSLETRKILAVYSGNYILDHAAIIMSSSKSFRHI